MSHEHDDTPPERDVLGYLVRLSVDMGEVKGLVERHQSHIEGVKHDVCELRDELRQAAPRIEDHTGRLKRLELVARAQGAKLTLWKGIVGGFVAALTLVGGTVAALAAAGVLR